MSKYIHKVHYYKTKSRFSRLLFVMLICLRSGGYKLRSGDELLGILNNDDWIPILIVVGR